MAWENGLTLGQIIETLELQEDEKLKVGFSKPNSYRGYYECLMFEPRQDITIGEMLSACREANGKVYTGYKGGEFEMGLDTECFMAEWGYGGVPITRILLYSLLKNHYEFEEFMSMLY